MQVLTVPSFAKIKFNFLLGFELKAVASGDHVLTLLLREYTIFLLSTERVFLKQSVNITFFIVPNLLLCCIGCGLSRTLKRSEVESVNFVTLFYNFSVKVNQGTFRLEQQDQRRNSKEQNSNQHRAYATNIYANFTKIIQFCNQRFK